MIGVDVTLPFFRHNFCSFNHHQAVNAAIKIGIYIEAHEMATVIDTKLGILFIQSRNFDTPFAQFTIQYPIAV